MGRLKDETWTTVAEIAASYVSSTFKSSTSTDTWIRMDGCNAVKFQLSVATLGSATKFYICPKFRDKAATVTYLYQRDNTTPVSWPLTAINNETPLFGPVDAYEVCAEVYADAATGATGKATVQAIRAKME